MLFYLWFCRPTYIITQEFLLLSKDLPSPRRAGGLFLLLHKNCGISKVSFDMPQLSLLYLQNYILSIHLRLSVLSYDALQKNRSVRSDFSLRPAALSALGQALDRLVTVSSTRYRASTSDLSTSSSLRGLTILRYGIPYLEVSFTLRCFQRLSAPHFATLPCRWRDNRCTIGAFIPVLSY